MGGEQRREQVYRMPKRRHRRYANLTSHGVYRKAAAVPFGIGFKPGSCPVPKKLAGLADGINQVALRGWTVATFCR